MEQATLDYKGTVRLELSQKVARMIFEPPITLRQFDAIVPGYIPVEEIALDKPKHFKVIGITAGHFQGGSGVARNFTGFATSCAKAIKYDLVQLAEAPQSSQAA